MDPEAYIDSDAEGDTSHHDPSASAWHDLSRIPPAMVEASFRLETAVRRHDTVSYSPCTATVVATARDTLQALGCLQRSDPVVLRNPAIAMRRKEVLQVLRNLVALTDRIAAAPHAAPPTSNDPNDPHAKETEAILAHSQALIAAMAALVDATPPVTVPHRQPIVSNFASLRNHAAETDSLASTPDRRLRSTRSGAQLSASTRGSTVDGTRTPSTRVPSQSAEHLPLGDAVPLAPTLGGQELDLVPAQLRDYHERLLSALVGFRTAALSHSRAATHWHARHGQEQSGSSQAPGQDPANTVVNVMDATLQTHRCIHKLISIVERLHGSPSLRSAYPDAMGQLATSQTEFYSAASHFLALVKSVTAPESNKTNDEEPNEVDPEEPHGRTQAERAAIAAASALAAGTALSRAGDDVVDAALTLVHQHERTPVLARLPLHPVSMGHTEPHTEPNTADQRSSSVVPSEVSESERTTERDFASRMRTDAVPRRSLKVLPPSDRRSRLSLLTRKVANLNMLRSTSSLVSLPSSSHGPRSSSSHRFGGDSTVPNTPGASSMTPSNDTLDSVLLPSSPAAQASRFPVNRASVPPSPGSSPASSMVFPARNNSVEVLLASSKRTSGPTAGMQGSVDDRRSSEQSTPNGLSTDLDADGVVRNATGDVLGGTLVGLVTTVAPSRDDPSPVQTAAFALTMHLFAKPDKVAQLLYDRYVSAAPGSAGETQRVNALDFARLWLSERFWRPTEDKPALTILSKLATDAHAADILSLVSRRVACPSQASMRIFCPSPGRVQLRRVIELSAGASIDELYTRPWVPSGAPNPSSWGRSGAARARSGVAKVTDLTPTELARQLTVLASRLWASVAPDEFLRPSDSSKSALRSPNPAALGVQEEQERSRTTSGLFNSTGKSGLPALSALSNRLVGWVAQEIVAPDSMRERRDVLRHFIKVSEKCLALNNLHVFFALQGGLASAPVRRLTRTWNALPAKYIHRASTHAALVDPSRNYVAYRKRLEQAIATGLPCVPFVGLALTDLTFALEGNAPMRRASGPLLRMAAAEATPSTEDGQLVINWARYARAAKIVSNLTATTNNVYALHEAPEVQLWLTTTLRHAPEGGKPAYDERLYRRSLIVEPRVARPSTSPPPTLTPAPSTTLAPTPLGISTPTPINPQSRPTSSTVVSRDPSHASSTDVPANPRTDTFLEPVSTKT